MDYERNIFYVACSDTTLRDITPQGISCFSSNTSRHKLTQHIGEVVSTLTGSQTGLEYGKKVAKFLHPQGGCYDESNQSLVVCDLINNRLRGFS